MYRATAAAGLAACGGEPTGVPPSYGSPACGMVFVFQLDLTALWEGAGLAR